VTTRSPKDVVEELYRRQAAGDEAGAAQLIAEDMVNHAAGPQGRAGLAQILGTIDNDLGPVTIEHHRLIAEGEYVAHHMTMHGHHRASTMPLLDGTEPAGTDVSWTYIHIWRVVDGQIVEHSACRDDLGLLNQIGAWPPS
jgi:lactoylglutathione lyase